MKVLFDSQIFGMQDYGGISRYYVEMMKCFRGNDVNYRVNLTISHNHYLKDLKIGYYDHIFPKNPYRNYIYTLINTIFGVPKLILSDFEVLHPTYYEPYFLPFIKKRPFVITVYDMVHELFSQEYPNLDKKLIEKKKLLLNKASQIIAISASTKNDIVNIYKIDPNKITVVHLANSLRPWNGIKKLDLPEKYLLYIGHRWIYKNFVNFVKSISELLTKKDTFLVCAGGNDFTADENKLFTELKISGRVKYQPISKDEESSECFARALAFVYPSRYEGFGIPILEAFANKCPVVCSNTSSFPEVARGAALYFDPENSNSMKKSVNEILRNNKLRQRLIKLGNMRIRNYSWKKAAKETARIYRKVIIENQKTI